MAKAKKKILILGVTASGKGGLAFELAKRLEGEIVSVDSMKVYRRMDIGTAKPSLEKRQAIAYHLIDVAEPSESFSVDRFLDLAAKAIAEIEGRKKTMVAAGGTAMYIKALLYGLFEGPGTDESVRARLANQIKKSGLAAMHARLAEADPEAAARIHWNDQKRIIRALEVYELTGRPISSFQKQWDAQAAPPEDWLVFGLRRTKEAESHRINLRVKRMIDEGLRDEVAALLAEDKPLSPQAAAAIGYAEMIEHLKGKSDLEETIEQIKINTRKFAKAQRTWFKTFRGMQWIDVAEEDTVETVLERVLTSLLA
ncbi:MAG: tRNA (adenosine(37)-N6)-dimethylallyltransferase MiaA [Planctomycetaceae bacterium]|nr:tRNA (adenosine(37)-N6)-dimethylallyltransferase MiaA [Planctomycetaceae bacterium]